MIARGYKDRASLVAPTIWQRRRIVHSSSPVRTPKLQLTAEQPSMGECWSPPKKDTLCPKAEKPQQDGRRGEITFRIKPHTHQSIQKAQTKHVHQGLETPERLSQTCLWVFECLLWRNWSAVDFCEDRGSGCSRLLLCNTWHKPSWRRSPFAPPESRQADDSQTAEQLYQRNSHTVKKILGPTTDWGSGRGTENPQWIWLWRPMGFDYRTSTGLGKQILGGHKQKLEASKGAGNVGFLVK